MFSDIVQRFDTPLNALYRERDARRAQGLKVTDLVSGNVHKAGMFFPPAILRQALSYGADRSKIYSPNPLGQPAARKAIQSYYRAEGLDIPFDQIVLTPGTSLSYSYLFKLLANSGDEILCPRPTYPLLDSIAELAGVRLTSYRLREKQRWEIDLEDLRSQISPKTRAIILISPHNPTGAVATDEEITGLAAIAAKHRLPIISDEVFSAFLFDTKRLPRPAAQEAPLVFTLNGVSKMLALPGLKIGWIAVTGNPQEVKKAVHALEMISDTFLPVNEAAQFALPMLFAKGKPFLSAYRQKIAQQAARAMHLAGQLKGISFIKPEGGFYLTMRIDTGQDEEHIALEILKQEGLLLHPGYFYDLEGSHLVISFVPSPPLLTASFRKISPYFRS